MHNGYRAKVSEPAHQRVSLASERLAGPATDAPQRHRAVLWGAVALLALVVLLTSLMSQQPGASWGGGPGVRLMPRLSDPWVYALGGLFVAGAIAVLAVLFPAELRFRRKKPDAFQLYHEPPKVTFGVYVVLVLLLALPIGFIVWLYTSGWQPLDVGQGQRQITPPARLAPLPHAAPAPAGPAEKPAVAAPGFAWTLYILATLVGLVMLLGGVWILFGDHIERWWYGLTYVEEARRALLNAVEIGLDDLLREPDPRLAIIVCYRRLEQVLAQHGLPRAEWQTPVEYVRAALQRFRPPATASAEGRRPFPAARLQGLTTLFELAKFSAHTLGEQEKQTAVEALRTVKAMLEELKEVPRVPTA